MLNFLRVIATMFVFLLHGRSYVGGVSDGPEFFAMITNFPAWAGVWILFFLSGYLIQKGFVSGKYQIFNKKLSSIKELFKFYLKRFLRIAPAYYLYIFLFLMLRGEVYFSEAPEIAKAILTFTYNGKEGISGLTHLWYVSTAMWLYVFAPLFSFLISKLKKTWLYSVAFALVAVGGRLCRESLNFAIENEMPIKEGAEELINWYEHVYTALPMNFDFFICGMLMCSITYNLRDKIPSWISWGLKAAALIDFLRLAYYNCNIYRAEDYYTYRYVLPTAYIIACASIVIAYDTSTRKRAKPTWLAVLKNPLRLIDKFSPYTYVFYIFHMMSFHLVRNNLLLWEPYAEMDVCDRYILFFCISFTATLIVSVLFTKMIDGLFKRKSKQITPH